MTFTSSRRRGWMAAAALVALCVAACGDDDGAATDADAGPDAAPGEPDAAPGDRDIVSTALSLDVTAHTGRAEIALAAGSAGARFEIGDLDITAVQIGGADATFTASGGVLEVDAPAAATTVVVTYGFSDHGDFDGWDATPGFTFLWPYFCKNLFPCDSHPGDGLTFTLEVTGVPEGQMAIYPASVPTEAPSYQIAIALGAYTYEALGTTPAGTEVGMYYLAGGRADALEGAGSLPGYMEFFETTYGDYRFGDRVASVSVNWGPGDYGGMEHHPYWHIDDGSMDDANTHAHEAGHGWFGDGIRIRCWEDFVLSEGVTTYLAARAIEAVDGQAAGDAQWAANRDELEFAVANGDTAAWPEDACNSIDIANHPLWSGVPYYKGAFFMRALEDAIGRAALDAVLREFYETWGGRAAGVRDLLDLVAARTAFDPEPLATAWLRGEGIPE